MVQQATWIADPTIEIGSDATGIPDNPPAVRDDDAVVFPERAQVCGPDQLCAQSHHLQLEERALKGAAAAAMSFVFQQVGLDAEGTNHRLFAWSPQWIDLFYDGCTVSEQKLSTLLRTSIAQGANDQGLLIRTNLLTGQRLIVDRRDRMRPGMGEYQRPVGL